MRCSISALSCCYPSRCPSGARSQLLFKRDNERNSWKGIQIGNRQRVFIQLYYEGAPVRKYPPRAVAQGMQAVLEFSTVYTSVPCSKDCKKICVQMKHKYQILEVVYVFSTSKCPSPLISATVGAAGAPLPFPSLSPRVFNLILQQR